MYPAVDELLKRVTGAKRTLIFDHTLRNGHIEWVHNPLVVVNRD